MYSVSSSSLVNRIDEVKNTNHFQHTVYITYLHYMHTFKKFGVRELYYNQEIMLSLYNIACPNLESSSSEAIRHVINTPLISIITCMVVELLAGSRCKSWNSNGNNAPMITDINTIVIKAIDIAMASGREMDEKMDTRTNPKIPNINARVNAIANSRRIYGQRVFSFNEPTAISRITRTVA